MSRAIITQKPGAMVPPIAGGSSSAITCAQVAACLARGASASDSNLIQETARAIAIAVIACGSNPSAGPIFTLLNRTVEDPSSPGPSSGESSMVSLDIHPMWERHVRHAISRSAALSVHATRMYIVFSKTNELILPLPAASMEICIAAGRTCRTCGKDYLSEIVQRRCEAAHGGHGKTTTHDRGALAAAWDAIPPGLRRDIVQQWSMGSKTVGPDSPGKDVVAALEYALQGTGLLRIAAVKLPRVTSMHEMVAVGAHIIMLRLVFLLTRHNQEELVTQLENERSAAEEVRVSAGLMLAKQRKATAMDRLHKDDAFFSRFLRTEECWADDDF